jgi:hypothetical protein
MRLCCKYFVIKACLLFLFYSIYFPICKAIG